MPYGIEDKNIFYVVMRLGPMEEVSKGIDYLNKKKTSAYLTWVKGEPAGAFEAEDERGDANDQPGAVKRAASMFHRAKP
jgi:hypothetical protein